MFSHTPTPTPSIKIIKPYARICEEDLGQGERLLRFIEKRARISHDSQGAQTADSYARFLRSVVMDKGDWSVAEHRVITVEAEVDRGITHEWVRHRLGSYTQESTRFVNYEQPGHEARWVCPPSVKANTDAYLIWLLGRDGDELEYRSLLKLGIKPQEARSALGTGLAARIDVTYNLRGWRTFLAARTTRESHPQMREVTIPLLEQFQSEIPILFEDIQPNRSQRQAMSILR